MRSVGFLSGIFLVICGLPELYYGLTTGTVGASLAMLVLWFLGEILGLIYVSSKKDMPLILNYSFNSVIVGALLFIKIKGM